MEQRVLRRTAMRCKIELKGLVVCILLPAFFFTTAYSDHLEPLPLMRTSYDSAIFDSLFGKKEPSLFMVALPSFKPQYAISIDETVEYKETDTGECIVTNSYFVLNCVSFKKRLVPNYPFDPSQAYGVDLSKDINRQEITIENGFANKIETAWASILKNTRYSGKKQQVLDGTGYMFHADHYYGLTLSPREGPSALLVELGCKLVSLVKSDETAKDRLKEECLELAERIINFEEISCIK